MKLLFLLLAMLLILTGCSTELHHGLSEKEANEILVVLHQHGLHAKKVKEPGKREQTWKVVVPSMQVTQAWQLLKEYKLPREKEKGFSEIFSNTNLIPTPTEEKALFLQALCGELSKTLESIEGVVNARVHVAMPDVNVFYDEEEPKPKPTASVLIEYQPEKITKESFVGGKIASLIANSVEGLSPKDVKVLFFPTRKQFDSTPMVNYFQTFTFILTIIVIFLALLLIISVMKLRSLKKELVQIQYSSKLMPKDDIQDAQISS